MMQSDMTSQKQAVIAKHGNWTAHNIRLTDELYTMGNRLVGDESKLQRIVQLVSDLQSKPFSELRILDLACLEGLYALEFAKRGATTLGIEGRESNIAKAIFSKNALGLEKASFVQDDVRNLSPEKHGRFDVVLCLGILYHLKFPDVLLFLQQMGKVTKEGGMIIIDSHISRQPWQARQHEGKTYWGKSFLEHPPFKSLEARLKEPWSSIDNTTSFWFTRASLINILLDNGFSSIFETYAPAEPTKPPNRTTMVGFKKPKQLPAITKQPESEQAQERFPWWLSWRKLLP